MNIHRYLLLGIVMELDIFVQVRKGCRTAVTPLFTLSYQSIKAALANPVTSLKYE
ncbi:MAG: hypothetical protein MUP98_02335 [Candidatus Aminicenantes bacterium]|nr:hypothetical protein [Candidatus Aminicenantes bacterium]